MLDTRDPLNIEKITTDSTNNDARLLAEEGAPNFSVVWAHQQTAARGRMNRNWQSIEGNVFWSMILRPELDWRLSDLAFVSALAVREAVASCILSTDNPGLSLKWPNDLLLNGGKLGGILIENHPPTALYDGHVVVGVGINVVDHPANPGMQYPPTDLHAHGYHECERDGLIEALTTHMREEVKHWQRLGFADVRERYLSHAHHLNHTIRVGKNADKSDYREGIYRGIDPCGQLLLETEAGKIEAICVGDVLNLPSDTSATRHAHTL